MKIIFTLLLLMTFSVGFSQQKVDTVFNLYNAISNGTLKISDGLKFDTVLIIKGDGIYRADGKPMRYLFVGKEAIMLNEDFPVNEIPDKLKLIAITNLFSFH